MKRLTMLWVAVVAAAAMTAAVGASAASADVVLCKVNESPCAVPNRLAAGQEVGGATLGAPAGVSINAGLKFSCQGLFDAVTTAESQPFSLPITTSPNTHLFECSAFSGAVPCASEVSKPSSGEIVRFANGTGIIGFGTGKEPMTLTLTCESSTTGKFTCRWAPGAGSLWVTYDPVKQSLSANELNITTKEGPAYLCGTGGKFSIVEGHTPAGPYVSST